MRTRGLPEAGGVCVREAAGCARRPRKSKLDALWPERTQYWGDMAMIKDKPVASREELEAATASWARP